jgi:hypothetical protein
MRVDNTATFTVVMMMMMSVLLMHIPICNKFGQSYLTSSLFLLPQNFPHLVAKRIPTKASGYVARDSADKYKENDKKTQTSPIC